MYHHHKIFHMVGYKFQLHDLVGGKEKIFMSEENGYNLNLLTILY